MAQDSDFYSVGLLLHCNGANGSTTFTDSSPRPKTVTSTGAQIVTGQSKFGGASAEILGGDYLTVPSSLEFGFGTGDFTIEYWIRPNLTGDSTQVILDFRASDSGIPLLIGLTVGGAVRYYDGATVRTGGAMAANTWHHVAWCRASGVNTVYLNGVSVSTYTATQDFGTTKALCIGTNVIKTAERFNGNVDDIRITKGLARYTGTFTPPAAALPDEPPTPETPAKDVNFTSVALLLHCNGANGAVVVPDDSQYQHVAAVVGTAAISTAKGKSGGASLAPGSHGVLIPSSTAFNFGSSDMTVEAWFAFTSTTDNCTLIGREWVVSPWTGGWTIQLRAGTSGPVRVYMADFNTGSPLLTGVSTGHGDGNWHHLAWTRQGNVHRLFLDGVLEATASTSTAFSAVSNRLAIGYDPTFGPRPMGGHVDEVRITNGLARYVKNFAVPPAPFPQAAVLSGVTRNSSGVPASRLVQAMRKDTGAFAGQATSDGTTGVYSIMVSSTGVHTLVAYPASGEDLPALALHGVVPV